MSAEFPHESVADVAQRVFIEYNSNVPGHETKDDEQLMALYKRKITAARASATEESPRPQRVSHQIPSRPKKTATRKSRRLQHDSSNLVELDFTEDARSDPDTTAIAVPQVQTVRFSNTQFTVFS